MSLRPASSRSHSTCANNFDRLRHHFCFAVILKRRELTLALRRTRALHRSLLRILGHSSTVQWSCSLPLFGAARALSSTGRRPSQPSNCCRRASVPPIRQSYRAQILMFHVKHCCFRHAFRWCFRGCIEGCSRRIVQRFELPLARIRVDGISDKAPFAARIAQSDPCTGAICAAWTEVPPPANWAE